MSKPTPKGRRNISIRLERRETTDGRFFVTSPDLRGFCFILEADDDPMEAMMPTLREFIPRYLDAELKDLEEVYSVEHYRAERLSLPHSRVQDLQMLAAVA